jgi:hypothetical protein
MASFVMMQPPASANSEPDTLPIAVRDGFSWLAFLVPPLWFAWRRLWVEAAVALAALILLNAIGVRLGMGTMASLLSLLVSLWAGLEAATMHIAGLRRRGYSEIGTIWANGRDEAELRFAASLDPGGEAIESQPAPMPRPQPVRPHAPSPAIGLVSFQGKS